ncbi:MAG: FtsX-like permease family protein [Candidatus Contendobacter sp.]|nr:FtsX-like permease family protein [Candidatus Contendobacter sp.]
MKALDRKLWRELWQMKGQAVAIMLVIVCGVAIHVMFGATLDALGQTRARYYQEYRFADVFAALKRAPESLRERIAALPGVAEVETRVVAAVHLDVAGFAEPITGRLVSIPDNREPRLNRLYLRQGRLPAADRNDEVVVSEAFAQAHRLEPGAKLRVVINGRRQALTLVGTALSPEYIHQLRPGSMFPDYQRYGVLWMGRRALGIAYGMEGAFNDVIVGLTDARAAPDVIDELDRLLTPYGGLGAHDREDQASHRFLSEEFRNITLSATLFPVLFLGVAIFLLNVVMNRLIGMQREQIGTLKAFGYGNGAIALHYLKLVLVVVLVGVAVGVFAGAGLGRRLAELYTMFFRFPFLDYRLTFQLVFGAMLLNLGGAMAGTAFALRAAFALRPAEAMRPEQPARYRATVIERLGLQRLLSQPNRMILRHIERRPLKSLLSVLGIALACGVTMAGRFQEATITHMVEVHYKLSQREDLAVTFTEPTSWRAIGSLDSLPGVERVEVYRAAPVRLRFRHHSRRTTLKGVPPGGDLQRLLDADLRLLDLPSEGVLLTDYLGELLGVQAGDRLTVEVLEGSRPVREVPVVGLVKEYLGVAAYMDLAGLNRLLREGPAISGAYLAVDDRERSELYRRLGDIPRIAGTAIREQEIRNFHRTMEQTMLFFTFIATVFAVVIAFGIIYNSARIALTERSRELASLRVLGFTRAEISYILLGELGLLTLVAIPLGFIVGRGICTLFVDGARSELYRIPLIIHPSTYAFAATVVLASALLSGWLVRRKLDRLDLIAVLKTRD